MTLDTAACQYSLALFQSASSKSQLEAWQTVLQKFSNTLQAFPDIKQFFCSPAIGFDKKLTVLKNAFQYSLDLKLTIFLTILLKKNKINSLHLISYELKQLILKKQNTLEAKLILTRSLPKEIKEKLQKQLEAAYKKNVVIEEEIDQSLIGGGVLLVGGKILDFSIKKKIKDLKRHLLSVSL